MQSKKNIPRQQSFTVVYSQIIVTVFVFALASNFIFFGFKLTGSSNKSHFTSIFCSLNDSESNLKQSKIHFFEGGNISDTSLICLFDVLLYLRSPSTLLCPERSWISCSSTPFWYKLVHVVAFPICPVFLTVIPLLKHISFIHLAN